MPDPVPQVPPPTAPAPPRVDVVDPLGVRGTIDAGDLSAFTSGGGRLVTAEEHATERADERAKAHTFMGDMAIAGPAYAIPMQTTGRLLPDAARAPLESYMLGVKSGMTLGLGDVATKAALEATGGKEAAKAYVEQIDDLKASHGTAHFGGELAGMVAGSKMAGPTAAGGAGALGRLGPVGAVEGIGKAIGGAVERSSVATGMASRGLGGTIAAGALKSGVSTAAEGALYGLANQVSEDLIHDKELTAEHLFVSTGLGALGGGILGGAFGGAGGALRGGLAKARPSLERALLDAAEAGAAPGKAIREAADAVAASGAAKETSGGLSELAKAFGDVSNSRARASADAMALMALGGTKGEVERAAGRVVGGAESLGSWVRKNIIDSSGNGIIGGAVKAGASGRSDEMLERIIARNAQTELRMGELIAPIRERVAIAPIMQAGEDIAVKLGQKAETVEAAGVLRKQMENLQTALFNSKQMGGSWDKMNAPLAELFYQRASIAKGLYDAKPRMGNVAYDAAKDWVREMDRLVVEGIDRAATKAGKDGAGAEIRALKADLNHGYAAEQIAEKGAQKLIGNNPIGIRVGISAGSALLAGHPVAGLAGLALGPVIQHRGMAAGSVLLSRLADAGTIGKVSAKVADWTERAARGVITPSASSHLPSVATANPGSLVQRAQQIVMAVRRAHADPAGFQQRLTQDTETVGRFAPETSLAYAAVATRALGTLVEEMPKVPPMDPLDANSPPRLTPEQAAKVVQIAEYTNKPESLFRDLEAGRISPEGMRVARVIMPRTVAAIEDSAYAEVSRRKLAGQPVNFAQRTRLTLMTGRAFDPLYQPAAMAVLQADAPKGTEPQDNLRIEKSHKPVNIPKSMQGSTLDRVTSR